VFVIVGLIHLLRAVTSTPIVVGELIVIPIWLSYVAGILLLVMGSYGLKHGRKGR
jgi:hypothetical protein